MKQLIACLLLSLSITNIASAQNELVVGWDGHLFPSFLISNAAVKIDTDSTDDTILGDLSGEIGVSIDSPGGDVAVKVTVRCDEFFEASEFTGTLADEGTSYLVKPKIRYRYDRLSDCKQATPATITFTIQVGDEPEVTQSTTATMHAVNDCPYKLIVGDSAIDISSTFAAYVNEQHPFMDKLLREALDQGIVKSFAGYQGDSNNVLKEVYALWDLMVVRDVRYSSITSTAAKTASVVCQHVRLIEESVNNSQTNCVDGSVLMVSLLRKIGINASLVLTNNHCYLIFSADPENKSIYALETTLMGSEMEEPETLPSDIDQAVEESMRDEQSWPSFVNALLIGIDNVNKDSEKAKSDPAAEFIIINVIAARNAGILPIAFNGKVEFTPMNNDIDADTVEPKLASADSDDEEEEESIENGADEDEEDEEEVD